MNVVADSHFITKSHTTLRNEVIRGIKTRYLASELPLII
ncbi:hypothetical protein HP15_p187g98 (plasmid) [Marinobacter adhaerens HP15]|uniref:Uncharacterized protein n=1 Tax=Marinobacter adhaerens (strain DSM 23420 / HP15) TaxID=225937 RepID=E4PS60_MARAH|nr:hypothetical protein HP15_p187g98 [Marinobacter adhaerens HP15]